MRKKCSCLVSRTDLHIPLRIPLGDLGENRPQGNLKEKELFREGKMFVT